MQKVHTKQVKKVNALQCNRCQDEFSNQDELKSHELNVDCAIRCPECSDVFLTKAERQEHQKENHFEESNSDAFQELDEAMWKKIKDSLKLYADSFKKKGKVPSDPDAERERWVIANTPRYEAGRSDAKFNSKLELGQWYTIFTTLAPNMKILDHPCRSHTHVLICSPLNQS
jgi:DNA-directed RNA polymerase subunit RPC12/RpoP